MKKLYFIFGLLLFIAPHAHAACTGSSPNWTTTPDAASVQTCLNNASSGDTINVTAGGGTATWTTLVSTSTPVTMVFPDICTGSGDPYGSTSGVITCSSNLLITMASSAGQLQLNGCGSRITGMNWTNSYQQTAGGVQMSTAAWTPSACFRLDHSHYTVSSLSTELGFLGANAYGLLDHNLCTDSATSGASGICWLLNGDGNTNGYQNWIDATNPGTNQAWYMEQNECTSANPSTPYGCYDSHNGGKIVARFNYMPGMPIGLTHGTDSGSARSAVLNEIYFNTVTNALSVNQGIFSTRGGTALVFNNVATGSGWQSILLSDYRVSCYGQTGGGCTNQTPAWGAANTGLNWTPVSNVITSANALTNTLNAAAYQTSHSYAAHSVALDSNGGPCNIYTVAGGTTGGSAPACPSTNGTVTDSGGVVWIQVGGSTSASPAPGTADGFCAVNPDTTCAANSTCNALSGGDTCSRYFDANGGVYPFRDQPGRVHNQVLYPSYEWLNSGAGLPSPVFATDAGAGTVAANRDYYDYNGSFTGAAGVGSGTFAAMPVHGVGACCTAGVAYWCTNCGSWNVSGNGQGNGVLYQSNGSAWSVLYTPYTYPDPQQGVAATSTLSGFKGTGVIY